MTFIMYLNFYLPSYNYADDTCVLLHGQNLNDLIISINKKWYLLFTWLQVNKLSLNGQKTHYMIFQRARIKLINHFPNVVIGGSILTDMDEINDFGVIIDNKITWIPHITYVKNKVSKGIGIIFKAKNSSIETPSLNCIIRIYTLS